jgi:hypothetical protein
MPAARGAEHGAVPSAAAAADAGLARAVGRPTSGALAPARARRQRRRGAVSVCSGARTACAVLALALLRAAAAAPLYTLGSDTLAAGGTSASSLFCGVGKCVRTRAAYTIPHAMCLVFWDGASGAPLTPTRAARR